MPLLQSVRGALTSLKMRFSGAQRWWGDLWYPRSTIDYRKDVGDGRGNSIVMACILWVMRTFPEAPVAQYDITGEQPEIVKESELVDLINTPNLFYSGELLWQATVADWMLTGNAYWLKQRNDELKPLYLWYVPSYMVEPKWDEDGQEFITHYEYNPGGVEPILVRREDVVHFRYGIDPYNIRKGLSPLASLIRTVFIDNEAERFTAALLHNFGIPGVIIVPEEGTTITDESATKAKEAFSQKFGGDKRGEPLVLGSRVKVQTLSFSPEAMDLSKMHRLPEERVSAILGTPAIVVGLGAGLEHAIFNNYSEAREAAYEQNIIPSQRVFGADVKAQLLPDFVAEPKGFTVGFDLTKVRILQPDQDALTRRVERALSRGWISLNEARVKTGYKPLSNGDLFYLPPNAVVIEQSLLTTILPASAIPLDNIDNTEGEGPLPSPIIMPKSLGKESYIIRRIPAAVSSNGKEDHG